MLNKKGVKSKVTTKGINKRVMWLQQFLDELQRDKMLRSFELFVWFFSAADRPAFEKKKKELAKIEASAAARAEADAPTDERATVEIQPEA